MVHEQLSRRVALGLGATLMSTAASAQGGGPLAGGPLAGAGTGPFATQPWGPASRIEGHRYSVERVRFSSGGVHLIGNLFVPRGPGPFPAAAMLGPVAFVKEQAPTQYATRLAAAGIVALAFDPRNHGESDGTPRRHEDGVAKAADLRAALDYLRTRPEVDADRINILGICQGVNWAVQAAIDMPAAARVALVAGHYLTPATALMYLGTPERVAQRLARSAAAAERFRRDGTLDYIPIVQARADTPDPDALLTALPIQQFYIRWADRGPFRSYLGLWENRITTMSEGGIWGHDISPVMPGIRQPLLMVHADRAASGPAIPRALLDSVPGDRKRLVMLDGRNQLQFYEDPMTIDLVAPLIVDHFAAGST